MRTFCSFFAWRDHHDNRCVESRRCPASSPLFHQTVTADKAFHSLLKLLLFIPVSLRVSQQQYQIKMTREAKVEELREDVVAQLEEMLAIKTEEVSIIQEQLSLLSKGYVKETKMKDPYGDTGIYTGHVKENVPNGKGTMEYDDGRLYVGEWDAGRWYVCD
jgi:hypothetical protein